jgi:hypothetical protein
MEDAGALIILAFLAALFVVYMVIWVVIHFWWLILSVGALWLLVQFGVLPWWRAGEDQRAHQRARREIRSIHDKTVQQMQEIARDEVTRSKP